jgi:hypothetical protein
LRAVLIAIVFVYICICLSAQSQPAPLSISPPKVDFGAQGVNSQAPAVTVTIRNESKSPVTIQEILCSGIDFGSQNNCAQRLQAGNECTILVSFRPAIAGDRIGILQITASDSPQSHFIPLTGIGTDQ